MWRRHGQSETDLFPVAGQSAQPNRTQACDSTAVGRSRVGEERPIGAVVFRKERREARRDGDDTNKPATGQPPHADAAARH